MTNGEWTPNAEQLTEIARTADERDALKAKVAELEDRLVVAHEHITPETTVEHYRRLEATVERLTAALRDARDLILAIVPMIHQDKSDLMTEINAALRGEEVAE